MSDISKTLTRRLQNAYPDLEAALKRLSDERGLVFYYGIDPTGPDIHLGHTIPLLLLKDLARNGHKAVILLGGFTARIGDPTGKNSVRKALSNEEVLKNKKTYANQIEKIFGDVEFSVRDNSEWLDKLKLSDFMHLAKYFTVGQILERDMFQERRKKDEPVFLHEFLYPLLQGYDSVHLKADWRCGK